MKGLPRSVVSILCGYHRYRSAVDGVCTQCPETSCDDTETRLALCLADDGNTIYNVTDCESNSPRPDTGRACPSTVAPCDVPPRWFTSPWNPVRSPSAYF